MKALINEFIMMCKSFLTNKRYYSGLTAHTTGEGNNGALLASCNDKIMEFFIPKYYKD